MNSSVIYKFLLLPILLVSINLSAQDKSILNKKSAVSFRGEILDPWYDFYNSVKIPTRMSISYERQMGESNRSFGIRGMYNSYKSYGYSFWDENLPHSTFDYSDTIIDPTKIGKTKGLGAEVYMRVFRAKKNSIFPVGFYYEFGLGIHNTVFTGYHFTIHERDGQTNTNTFKPYEEPKRNITTANLSFKIGKQWLFENDMFFGYGLCLRGHIPLDLEEDPNLRNESQTIQTLYGQDILGTDWLSTFINIGRLF